MGQGIIKISPELFLQVLGLPGDTEILDIRLNRFSFPAVIEVSAEHPGLYIVGEGETIPFVNPVFEEDHELILNKTKFVAWDKSLGANKRE